MATRTDDSCDPDGTMGTTIAPGPPARIIPEYRSESLRRTTTTRATAPSVVLMFSPLVLTAIAIAVAGTLCLAVGTHLQHRGVKCSRPDDDTGPGARVLQAMRQPVWLLGTALIVIATVMNVVALGLAPVALVQPVGCLSLIAAAVISSRSLRIPIGPGLLCGIALTVVSVGIFVGVSAGFSRESRVDDASVAVLCWLLAGLGIAGWGIAGAKSGHLARVIAAGVIFGAVASAVHVLAAEVLAAIRSGAAGSPTAAADWAAGLDPAFWMLGALTAVAVAIGAWLVQTAYASGPPETVLAGLTVIDPMIAIVIGAAVLGEYSRMPGAVLLLLAASGAAALAGIATVVRHHPDFAKREPIGVSSPLVETDGAPASNRRG